ncbi:MAG: hypothetical protein RDV41_08885 [Planctomycetota bacterium]|nr:hypothetical protein [Planctomycetota bacterium]
MKMREAMRLFLCFGVLCIVAAMIGCQAAQEAYSRTFSNWRFEPTGYSITSPYGKYIYKHSQEPASCEKKLTFGYGFEERTLIDIGCDGAVDTAEYKSRRYHRTDSGSEELFKEADTQFAYYEEKILARRAHEQWISMTNDEVARRQGFFKKP